MGKIIVEEKPEGSNDIETWKILDDVFSNYFKWEKYINTHEKIKELLEVLIGEAMEMGIEEGIERVVDSPSDYMESRSERMQDLD